MKKRDEIKELRELGEGELEERALSIQEELMKLRFRHASGQLEQTAQLNVLRRRVARIKTLLQEKQSASRELAAKN
jgi:large subunit ribosomal protein L29